MDNMDRTERFYKIDALLQSGRAVPIGTLLDMLEVSRATFKRDIEYMRDRLNYPIVWDREAGGYRYEQGREGETHNLPGLWFNAQEAYALLMMQAMLSDLQPTLLKTQIEPLKARLRALIESGQHPAEDVDKRFRLLTTGHRAVQAQHFEMVATALLSRRRLALRYYVRTRDERGDRLVSPQVIVHYRGSWYLVAWCHMRNGLRSFALDAIEEAHLVEIPAQEVDSQVLEDFVGQGYGIFSGGQVQWARLRFTEERARWVAHETWHPKQEIFWLPDGRMEMRLPFTDLRELTLDVLRHGSHVEALEPAELRNALRAEHQLAANLY
jgi:predicted DNA-binding transcriptional regulator YafY